MPLDASRAYTVHVRNIAKQFGAAFAAWSEKERTELTRAHWESGKFEEGAAAIQLYARMRRKCGLREWTIFTRRLTKFVRNWAHCDGLCGDVLGHMLIANPEWVSEVNGWAVAEPVYQRRGASVPVSQFRKCLRSRSCEFVTGYCLRVQAVLD